LAPLLQAVGTALSQTEASSVAAKIQALFRGAQGHALAQIVAQALAGLDTSSAGGKTEGSAQGSDSASVSGSTTTNAEHSAEQAQ
jgi:hypothetical protein